ncbi:hypothetical protein NA56DRAFT_742660 [Hyaloscypha hepaticicola]|uniref:NAD(P)-binding protein n=1 Tax=Hyaloscypha hepaticicola TaxID=2082293 RepID=A0A2J6QQI6_9HELO|nr:hypothetical protein NA56DRAFT_742660 [Hyaloscypha hepaticicola]
MSSNTNKQSSSSSGAVNNNSSKAPSSDRKSDYRLIKDAGFNNMNHMMQSYGLKMSEHEDIQEARAILDGLRKIDEANGRNELFDAWTIISLGEKGPDLGGNAKAELAIQEIQQDIPRANIALIEMDLSDLDSVKRGAGEFSREENKLHILINNAGRNQARLREPISHELSSHHFLTRLLLPVILRTSSPRSDPSVITGILIVSSDGHAKLVCAFSPSSLAFPT